MSVEATAPPASIEAVGLRPMTDEEFVRFRASFVQAWAADLAILDDLAPAAALAEAAARTDADLPEGLATAGHHLYTILAGERAVGSVWFSLDARGQAFLDEVTIAADERGRGYGRRALVLVEAMARALGANRMELNVYQHNPRALALYQALGYVTTKQTLRKAL